MDPREAITTARDAMTVRQVFGEPYERDGVTVIPAATVMGGAGSGSGGIDLRAGPAPEGRWPLRPGR